jgi:hypothetical protein
MPIGGLMPSNVFIFMIVLFVASCGNQDENSDETEIDLLLAQTAYELNKRLPEMLDENTVLEATSGSNNYFTYFYTLTNYMIDEVDVEAFENMMRPNLINSVCTSGTFQKFISNGVTIRYIYSDKDFREFSSISVEPSVCENNARM